MSRLWISLTIVLVFVSASRAQDDAKAADAKKGLETTKQQASYGIGLSIGRQLQRQGLLIDPDALAKGIADILNEAKPQLTDEEIEAAVTAFERKMQAEKVARDKAAAEKNKKDGEAFLAANKKKDGVVTLESGLQYKVLKKGAGPKPKGTDTVRTHYHGTLIGGKVFDSSVERGEPATFPVGGVIRGWTEALKLMPVGSKWRLFVPSALAYGPRGAGGDIGPHATLIFDVELLAIE